MAESSFRTGSATARSGEHGSTELKFPEWRNVQAIKQPFGLMGCVALATRPIAEEFHEKPADPVE